MTNDEKSVLDIYNELIPALLKKDICVLNRILLPTAELYLSSTNVIYSKYAWIDLIQNKDLVYSKFFTIGVPTVKNKLATINSRIELIDKQKVLIMGITMFFVKDGDFWFLSRQYSQNDSSKKPIDSFENWNWSIIN